MTEDLHNLPSDPQLQKDLQGLFAPPRFRAERDAAILSAARRPRRTYWRAVGLAIAAAVAVAATLFVFAERNRQQENAAYARTGDIRDAFYVARQLKAHAALEAQWDATGDGKVDDADVEALRFAAVRLGSEGVTQ